MLLVPGMFRCNLLNASLVLAAASAAAVPWRNKVGLFRKSGQSALWKLSKVVVVVDCQPIAVAVPLMALAFVLNCSKLGQMGGLAVVVMVANFFSSFLSSFLVVDGAQ